MAITTLATVNATLGMAGCREHEVSFGRVENLNPRLAISTAQMRHVPNVERMCILFHSDQVGEHISTVLVHRGQNIPVRTSLPSIHLSHGLVKLEYGVCLQFGTNPVGSRFSCATLKHLDAARSFTVLALTIRQFFTWVSWLTSRSI